MHFISILIVLVILQYRRSWIARVQNDSWFFSLQNRFDQQAALKSFLISIVLPVAGLALLLTLLHSVLWGFLDLVLSVVVLMYALGRGHYISLYNAYQAAWQAQDNQQIIAVLQTLEPAYTPADSHTGLHTDARYLFIHHAFTRLFVVLFWFALAGPVAALLYRLVILTEPQNNSYAKTVANIMEWPVARLFSFSAALLGNFSAAFAQCKLFLLDTQKNSSALIHDVALAALNQDMQWQSSRFVVENDETQIADKAISEIQAIRQLIHRCTVFAVVFIAVFYVVL